jgi:hypothetical protein
VRTPAGGAALAKESSIVGTGRPVSLARVRSGWRPPSSAARLPVDRNLWVVAPDQDNPPLIFERNP